MPSYKSFTATIHDTTTLLPLREYMTSHNPLTNTCQTYIESSHNQPFTIILKDEENVFAQGTAVFVDGVYVDNGLTGPGVAVERRWYGKRVDHVFVKPFVFRENLSDSTAIWDADEIGTIRLVLRRCNVGNMAQDQTNRGCVPEDISPPPVRHLHTRDDYLAHRTEFSSPKQIPATLYHVTWLDHPPNNPSYLEFKFIYRSRQVLIAQGIIPGPLPQIKREEDTMGSIDTGNLRGEVDSLMRSDHKLATRETGRGDFGGRSSRNDVERDLRDFGRVFSGGSIRMIEECPGVLGDGNGEEVTTPPRKRKATSKKRAKKDIQVETFTSPMPTTSSVVSTETPSSVSPDQVLGTGTTAPPSLSPLTTPKQRAKRPRNSNLKKGKSKAISLLTTAEGIVGLGEDGEYIGDSGGDGTIHSSPIEAAALRRTSNVFRNSAGIKGEIGNGNGIGGTIGYGNENETERGLRGESGSDGKSESGGMQGQGQSMASIDGGLGEGGQFEILRELRELREEVKRLKSQRYTITEDFPVTNPYHILAQPRDPQYPSQHPPQPQYPPQSQYPTQSQPSTPEQQQQSHEQLQRTRENTVVVEQPPPEHR